MSKIIRKIQGMWIWTLFICLKILNWVNSGKQPYGFKLNSNLRCICNCLCNWLLLNGIANRMWPWTSHYNVDHVFEKFIIFTLDCFVCSIDVQLESEATPFVEDTVIEPHQQGKQPPLIMSIKTYFPLSLVYAWIGWSYCVVSTA